MLRVFSPTGFQCKFTCFQLGFESGFTGFLGLLYGQMHSPSRDTGAFPYFGINIVSLG
jgi:hypothetical protein